MLLLAENFTLKVLTRYNFNKVIENDTIQSGTLNFVLTFHSNHRPISHRFRDKLFFSHPRVFNAPAEAVPLGIWYRRKGLQKLK